MSLRVLVRLVGVLALGALALLAFAPGSSGAASSASRVASSSTHAHDGSTTCPSEANSCVPVSLNWTSCTTSCSLTAGPVSQVGQNQASYVDISGLPSGEEVGLAMCSLTTGSQPVSQPVCASYLPPSQSCTDSCNPTPSPSEWQYATASGGDTVLSIGTQFDPEGNGDTPITSQTPTQYDNPGPNGPTFGSFYCDNSSNPCGIEVMDLGNNQQYVVADGYPPKDLVDGETGFVSSSSNTVIIPLNFASSGSGCGGAPIMQVDASYSVAQFLPAAGAATCTKTGGVVVLPTDMPSVDDSTCAATGATHCPVTDVINGAVPATFSDDPNDPATVAALKTAGGKFAWIPIAVSSTEIAFEGQAGITGGNAATYPLSSYNLTPAQTAGIMTQYWTDPVATEFLPQDDLCAQLSGTAKCTETESSSPQTPTIYEVNGQYANYIVDNETGGTPVQKQFDFTGWDGTFDGVSYKDQAKNYSADTGYALLNPWPFSTGVNAATESNLEAMFPSTASGSSYESTGWICSAAANTPYKVNLPAGGSATLSDILSGPQILADAELGPIQMTQSGSTYTLDPTVTQNITSDPKGCQALSSLPTDLASTVASDGYYAPYAPSSQPLTAAHVIQGVISKGLLGFAFSAMDSSEADFFGLLPANLQNASGAFVAPSTAAVTAALNDMQPSPNQNGTLVPDYTTTDASAYPMPMITYALISTSPQPSQATADQLTNMLTNLVNYSSTSGAGTSEPLPPGYVALPQNLQTAALADIAKDVIAPDGQPVGGEGPQTTGSGGTGPGSTTGSTGGPGGTGGSSYHGGNGTQSAYHSSQNPSSNGSGTSGGSSGGGLLGPANFVGRLLTVTLGDNRFLVPGLLLLGLLCVVLGPLLYLSPNLKRPVTASAGDDAGPDGGGAGPPPPGDG